MSQNSNANTNAIQIPELTIVQLPDYNLLNQNDYFDLTNHIDFDQIFNMSLEPRITAQIQQGRMSQTKKRDILSKVLDENLSKALLIISNNLYFFSKDGLILINQYNRVKFAKFLMYLIEGRRYTSNGPFKHDGYLDEDSYIKLVKIFEQAISKTIESNDMLQFPDAHIIDNDIIDGVSPITLASHHFKYPIKHLITSMQPTDVVPEVDDLILHIANNDQDTANRFIDNLSLVFINDVAIKQHYQRFSRVYGPTTGNGKSTLANLIMSALSQPDDVASILPENVRMFNAADIDGFKLGPLVNALIGIEQDARESFWNDETSSNLKGIISGDTIEYRNFHSRPEQKQALVQLLSFSNFMPKSSDKTKAFDRRIDWYETKHKLERDDEWFAAIRSEKASRYLFEKLFIRSRELTQDLSSFSPETEQMLKTKEEYKRVNNNVLLFIDEYGSEYFEHWSTQAVYVTYKLWCKDNDESAFGSTKFKDLMKDVCKFNIKKVRYSDLNPTYVEEYNVENEGRNKLYYIYERITD